MKMLQSFAVGAAALLAISSQANAGTLTVTSGPTLTPSTSFTNSSILQQTEHNPSGVNGDRVRISGGATIAPNGSNTASITLSGTYSAAAGERFTGAYSFVVNSDMSGPVNYTLSGSVTVLGNSQAFQQSGTVEVGLNQYKGTFTAPIAFPFSTTGSFSGSLTFTFPSSQRFAATAPGTMDVSIEQVDFQLAPTAAATLPPSQPLNISTRMAVGTADDVLIAGFIIDGDSPKKVLIRGLGPSLTGVTGPLLQDPTLELHAGEATFTNDNWKSDQAEVESTGIPPTNDAESAIVATLDPGAYTAILAGKNETTGVGLVEVYDLDQSATTRLANISTRGLVQTGDNVMIGGFILGPDSAGASSVVVRALGPSLDVSNSLQNPTLELRDANGDLITSNDNWAEGPDAQTIQDDNLAPPNENESALLAIPSPGNYTAIVRGVDETTGVGLVEIYHLQ